MSSTVVKKIIRPRNYGEWWSSASRGNECTFTTGAGATSLAGNFLKTVILYPNFQIDTLTRDWFFYFGVIVTLIGTGGAEKGTLTSGASPDPFLPK